MSNLISRSELIEEMKKAEIEYENAMMCPSWWSAFNIISGQPTAYDVDKVVKELNKLDVKAIKRYKGGTFGDYEGTDYYIKKSEAIEIVKAGGKNE